MMAALPPCFDRAVAAPPPHSAPHEADRRPSTPLSAVFRRIGAEPSSRSVPPPAPAPSARPRPAPAPSARPQLLGFAEPVDEVPPIEAFLSHSEEPVTSVAAEPVEIAALEPAPVPEPERESEPEPPEPPPVFPARVGELPPAPAPEPAPSGRPESLVGRLGRRLGDAPSAAPAAPPAAAHQLGEPPPASAQPWGDRSGRPSLPRNRRAYRRASLPAEIEIGGVPCTLIDVSIGGFAASGVPPIEPNALVPVTIRLVIDGIEVGTQLSARIIYVTRGRSSGRFIELGPSQMAFLRYIVTWRGESVGAVGTTTLLDAIAGGADRGFVPGAGDRSDPEAKSRWWAGLIGKKVNRPR